MQTIISKKRTSTNTSVKFAKKQNQPPQQLELTQVLILSVEFWELSHLTLDLSEAEKKITEQMTKMATIFTQNDNFDHFECNGCHFVHLLSL